MPYKDPEKRRTFHREYKRKWRQVHTKNQPLKGVKIFICARFPDLNLGLASFVGGFLITSRDDVVERILRDPDFMRFIFPISMDWDLVPNPIISEDE